MERQVFKGELMKHGYTFTSLAAELGYSYPTLIRRIDNDAFTVKDAATIARILGEESFARLFFGLHVS